MQHPCPPRVPEQSPRAGRTVAGWDKGPASWEGSPLYRLLPESRAAWTPQPPAPERRCLCIRDGILPSAPRNPWDPRTGPRNPLQLGCFQTPGQTPSLPRGHPTGPAAHWLRAPSPPRCLTPWTPETSLKPSWCPLGLGEPSVSKDQGPWGPSPPPISVPSPRGSPSRDQACCPQALLCTEPRGSGPEGESTAGLGRGSRAHLPSPRGIRARRGPASGSPTALASEGPFPARSISL